MDIIYQTNSDTPSKKWGILGVVSRTQEVHRVVFTASFMFEES